MTQWNRVSPRPIDDVIGELQQARTLTITTPRPGIAVMSVNRPDRGNSQTIEMFGEIAWYAHTLRKAELRALIVTGAGGAAFCTGFDLAEVDAIAEMSIPEFTELVETAEAGTSGLRALPFPVIAAICGPAAGGGLSLALSADIRLGVASASFSAGFVRIGLSIGELGASWHLSRLVGPAKAAELAFTGRTVRSSEAVALGLLNRVVGGEVADVVDTAIELAEVIADNDDGAIRATKAALIRNAEIDSFLAALELENRNQTVCRTAQRR
jgi:enoyl-CoA hydratase/carnithine racemase